MPQPLRLTQTDDAILQQLDAMADSLPSAFLQWSAAPAGQPQVEQVSDGLWSLLGHRSPPSLGGAQAFWSKVDPRDADRLLRSLEQTSADREWRAHWRMMDATGQPLWLLGHGKPWPLASGGWRCRAFVGLQNQDDAALEGRRASERRFRDLIDAIPNIAVQGYDHQLVCRFWNAASEQLYGYTAEEAIGTNLLDLIIPAAMRGAVIEATTAMLGSGQAIPSAELVLQDKQGRAVHVHSGHVLLQRPGHTLEFFCIDFDLNERRQAEASRRQLEAQLREVQKMEAIGTLAGGIAHDFNNILAAILGNVNLALEDTDADHPNRISLLEIQKAGRRARALTQQILTFARRQEEKREPVALGPLVQELQGVFRTTLPPGTRLAIEIGDALPDIVANATQIQQVLINLVANAVQACAGRNNPQVTVRLCATDGPPLATADRLSVLQSVPRDRRAGVLLEVRDNGNGMAPEVAQRVFEPFFTTKAVQKGTGLGLAVVHGILRDHNAELQLHSVPDQGTCFSIWLAGADTALPPPSGI